MTDRTLRTRGTLTLSLACLTLVTLASPGAAQTPGYQQLDISAIHAEYNAEVLSHVNELLAEWGDAWANDRVDELAELYWEEAMLIPPDGNPRRGREELRAYFQEALPNHGQIEAFMLDFDASGGMSQVYGNYMLGIQAGEGAGSQKSGPMMTVYLRRGRTWKIRGQFFLPT
jgi:ketosteroid isomerase-like protein